MVERKRCVWTVSNMVGGIEKIATSKTTAEQFCKNVLMLSGKLTKVDQNSYTIVSIDPGGKEIISAHIDREELYSGGK